MKCKKEFDGQKCVEEVIPHTGFCEAHYLEVCQGKTGAVQVLLLNDILNVLRRGKR